MKKRDIGDQRQEFQSTTMRRSDMAGCPMEQFSSWYADAERHCEGYPNPMILATVDDQGRPDSRVVLLKSFDQEGFVFYTNYDSAKAQQIKQQPTVSLLFFWEPLERQVRIRGRATKNDPAAADAYFASRPRGSQIGAAASNQSEVITSKSELENQVEALEEKYEGSAVPRPDNWGGYVVVPSIIEFWQGQPNRLHDRLVYSRTQDDGHWEIKRLAP